jgi:hypothetical protein
MRVLFALIVLQLTNLSFLQAQDDAWQNQEQLPGKFLDKIERKINHFDQSLTRSTEKYLNKLIKQEKQLQKKLASIDSSAAKQLFTSSIDSLQKLKQQLVSGKVFNKAIELQKDYDAYLDSLSGSLAFLRDAKQYLQQGKNLSSKLNIGNEQLALLKNKLQTTDAIRQYARERKETIAGYFSGDKIKGLAAKQLQQLTKTNYYYLKELADWRSAFSDPLKLEAKAMNILRNLPLFKRFMAQHSELAGLLNPPANYGQSTAGLQTRDDIMKQIAARFGGAGPNVQQVINGQLDAAKNQLKTLKEKFPQLNGTAEMPDFQPKELKTKTFFQRLEYSTNFNFNRQNTFLPTRADIALQVGYKYHKNGIAGIGIGYIAGLGKNVRNIRLTHEGINFRSYVDWNINKAQMHINGGWEYNYLPTLNGAGLTLNNGARLNTIPWQPSALLGISRKFKIGKKTNKQAMILYDFMHKSHFPNSEAVKFRVGYSF